MQFPSLAQQAGPSSLLLKMALMFQMNLRWKFQKLFSATVKSLEVPLMVLKLQEPSKTKLQHSRTQTLEVLM
jgi:hypothetical protein